MPRRSRGAALPLVLAGAWALAAGPAHAADKFKVTSVNCELFWLWKRTPTLYYDIVDERRPDYDTNPAPDYFREAAVRTAEFCNRTSAQPQQALGPPRKIRGIWFHSNDGQFKILYNLDDGSLDTSAGVTNRIGDQHAEELRAAAQLEQIRTREARDREVRAAEQKAEQDRVAAINTAEENRVVAAKKAQEDRVADARKAEQDKAAAEDAREKAFFDSRDLQVARLGAAVTKANFAAVQDVRTNPFHFRKLGVAVVRTEFNRMVSDSVALFGNEIAPVFVHIEDVDRFTRSGETVLLALKITERGEVERSYGSLPEVLLSALKADPLFGEYVGAYTCPRDDCNHVFDASPPT